jgi:hypothetical protein
MLGMGTMLATFAVHLSRARRIRPGGKPFGHFVISRAARAAKKGTATHFIITMSDRRCGN